MVWDQMMAVSLLALVPLVAVVVRRAKTQTSRKGQAERAAEREALDVASKAELRNHETAQHQDRVIHYVELIARSLHLSDHHRCDLVRAAPLYDIGIGGIPDAILLKPGPLTPGERANLETHCLLGDQILAPLESQLGHRSFLTTAREMALGHHERWDGTGYPGRVAGRSIPLGARILALVDVYDALRSCRPYKDSQTHDVCVHTIQTLSGSHFDPHVVDAFLRVEGEFNLLSTMSGWMDCY